MTFLPFLLNRSRLPIFSYKFFLFLPVPLKSVKKKKKSIYACILINKISKKKKKKKFITIYLKKQIKKKKKKKSIYACILMNKISKKKKKVNFFSILACNTSNTECLIYSLSQHLTSLANDFPAFFA